MKYFPWLTIAAFFFSCDTNRVFEDNVDFEENSWTKDNLVSFDFEISDTRLPYNIYANIRNASAYPYHNLYYQYALKDSSGTILRQKQQYIDLFDPKTGEPFGSGLGDLFDHQQLIIENYEFPSLGRYSITFQHYMRKDTLPLILAIGTRVERVNGE